MLKVGSSYHASSYNGNGSSEYASSRIQNDKRRTVYYRLIRIIILCLVMFRGFQIGLGMVRSVVGLVFGHKTVQQQQQEQQPQEFDTIDNLRFTLRGSTDNDGASGGMSRHDLNAQTHALKVEDEPSLDREQEDPIEKDTTEEDKASEGYEVYMGKDSTVDYFFAGHIKSTKNIVDKSGGVKAVTIPAQKYATLPFSVDSHPFALSMWVYLSPLSEIMDKDVASQDSRTTRVIFSTLSGEMIKLEDRGKDSRIGCTSDVFGGPAKGIVLYARPDYSDSSWSNENRYRILLQYASTGSKSCHTIGLNKDAVLVSEAQWSHISVFVTRVDSSQIEDEEGDERVSLYVGGDLAGRDYVEGRVRGDTSETLVGRTRDVTYSKQKNSEYRGLGGRVGMLSFWELGGPESLVPITERMQIKSVEDEDHVTRAISRVAFDLRAIRELSLLGLIVKEPDLLYTFDGQDDKVEDGQLHDLYDQPTNLDIKEITKGKDGTIRIADMNGAPLHNHEYVPLGGFRYPEYRDGKCSASL